MEKEHTCLREMLREDRSDFLIASGTRELLLAFEGHLCHLEIVNVSAHLLQ